MALLTGKDTEGLCGHSEEGEGPALLRLLRQKYLYHSSVGQSSSLSVTALL